MKNTVMTVSTQHTSFGSRSTAGSCHLPDIFFPKNWCRISSPNCCSLSHLLEKILKLIPSQCLERAHLGILCGGEVCVAMWHSTAWRAVFLFGNYTDIPAVAPPPPLFSLSTPRLASKMKDLIAQKRPRAARRSSRSPAKPSLDWCKFLFWFSNESAVRSPFPQMSLDVWGRLIKNIVGEMPLIYKTKKDWYKTKKVELFEVNTDAVFPLVKYPEGLDYWL